MLDDEDQVCQVCAQDITVLLIPWPKAYIIDNSNCLN